MLFKLVQYQVLENGSAQAWKPIFLSKFTSDSDLLLSNSNNVYFSKQSTDLHFVIYGS